MKVAIKDANVLIDLEVAGLLDAWFQLGYETYTTDLIERQLWTGGHEVALSYARAGHIRIHKCIDSFLADTFALLQELGAGPDITDCSVLLLAMRMDAILLSGDRPLRSAAAARQVEVHGTLWIFDKIVDAGLLNPVVAAQKLQLLMNESRYLPKDQCQQRIRRWTVSK